MIPHTGFTDEMKPCRTSCTQIKRFLVFLATPEFGSLQMSNLFSLFRLHDRQQSLDVDSCMPFTLFNNVANLSSIKVDRSKNRLILVNRV